MEPRAIELNPGTPGHPETHLFRFIVLNVRSKTADQFPTFLTQTDQILKTVRFPG